MWFWGLCDEEGLNPANEAWRGALHVSETALMWLTSGVMSPVELNSCDFACLVLVE